VLPDLLEDLSGEDLRFGFDFVSFRIDEDFFTGFVSLLI